MPCPATMTWAPVEHRASCGRAGVAPVHLSLPLHPPDGARQAAAKGGFLRLITTRSSSCEARHDGGSTGFLPDDERLAGGVRSAKPMPPIPWPRPRLTNATRSERAPSPVVQMPPKDRRELRPKFLTWRCLLTARASAGVGAFPSTDLFSANLGGRGGR